MGKLVLITGSREATEPMLAKAREVVRWCQHEDHAILCGDACGIDAEVRKTAAALGVLIFVYGAYGTIRGPCYAHEQPSTVAGNYLDRDRVMARQCDLCIAIWNGRSRGTEATARYARQAGKRVIVRTFAPGS
jgi:predicted Rossmann fold nucleotide-binding protein DprA/Smf involved in DNA uptake